MHATLPYLEQTDFPAINRRRLETLQVNLGYRCNQSCLHCHVNAGPTRKEQMTSETVGELIDYLGHSTVTTLDLTGGAPELNPNFCRLVESARGLGKHVIDRCNLTVLNEPGFETLAGFLAMNKVEIVASLPCYLEKNVESQRGKGVYDSSITAIRKLNELGYAQADSELVLNLMYNPAGPVLPPSQQQLEADYKRELDRRAGIQFNRLYTLTNMPIQRFGSMLLSKGQFAEYMAVLRSAHQDSNLETVMCRSLVSVDWEGYLYDCDFNQMLGLPLELEGQHRTHIRDLKTRDVTGRSIVVANHCYGCTAGQGSSCGGALD